MIAFKPLLSFLFRTAPLWLPAVLAGALAWYVQGLRVELSETQQELSQLQAKAVTDDVLQAVKSDITAVNVALERQIAASNAKVSQSLNTIRAQVEATGSEIERLQMQLHPAVSDEIDRVICDRGYKPCD